MDQISSMRIQWPVYQLRESSIFNQEKMATLFVVSFAPCALTTGLNMKLCPTHGKERLLSALTYVGEEHFVAISVRLHDALLRYRHP